MAATDYQSLYTQAVGYAGLSGVSSAQLLKLALLKQIAATVAPTVATDYQSLLSSTNVPGYAAASPASLAQVLELALLQIIAQNVSGGAAPGTSSVTYGNYSGGQPSFTPASGNGMAVDTSDGAIWVYVNGVWE
jgi:hypothetical protein